MKKYLAWVIASMAIVGCTTQQKTEPEKTLAQQLEERLDSLQRNAETEHFGPVPNTPCGDDYTKAFKEAENVMFLEDIKD